MSEPSEVIFTFFNTHDAIASERALLGDGFSPRVMPLPSQLGAGCGICLRVWKTDCSRASGRLAEAGITPQGLWEKQTNDDQKEARYLPVSP